jgi:hypothetical protein
VLHRNIEKELIMSPSDITAIERQARQLRAQEMQRILGLIAAHLRLYGQLLVSTALLGLAAIGSGLRLVFSWNPQARHPS